MKTVIQHIEHVRNKPHHVRKRVAFGIAGGATALIGLVWLGGSLATGAFKIQGSDFAMSVRQHAVVATTSASGVPAGLAGAAAALEDAKAPAHIEIVDTTPAPTKKAEATVIPF